MEQGELFEAMIEPGDLPHKTLLRVDEVAQFFRVTTKTIYTWCELGRLESCNPNGGALRIIRQSAVGLLEKRSKE